MKNFYFMPALVLAFFFTGCTFWDEGESVSFTLPGEGLWVIHGACGGKTFSIEEEGPEVVLFIGKNEPCALLASRKNRLEIYGAISPFATVLDQETAWAAEVFYSLTAGSTDSSERTARQIQFFNWGRLIEECRDYEGNLWALDKEHAMKAIASGKFKKSDLKLQD